MLRRCGSTIATALSLVLIVGASATATARGRAAPNSGDTEYESARRVYYALKGSAQRQRFRHHWIKAIAAFNRVQAVAPSGPHAAAALFNTAALWRDLFVVSRLGSDGRQAEAAFARLAALYPASALADDALLGQARLVSAHAAERERAVHVLGDLLARYPGGDMAASARTLLARLGVATTRPEARAHEGDDAVGAIIGRSDEEGRARPRLTGLKTWGSAVYSRVALYLSAPVEARLVDDAGEGGAATHRLDLVGATLAPGVLGRHAVTDPLLTSVTVTQLDSATVRVSLALESPARLRTLVLEDPYRIVIEALVEEGEGPVAAAPAVARRPRVVLDPGHGGIDGGAHAASGLREKDVTLAIATEAERLLVAQGIDVVLTRQSDVYVSLEERTAIANRAAADVFVSVHANSCRACKAHGIETYYLDTTDDRYALKLAARENATQEDRVSDVQLVLADLAAKAATKESQALAVGLQQRAVETVRPLQREVRDLGVKASLFYVLLGARMPAVLIETGFLSNKREGTLLADKRYRSAVAAAIATAVRERIERLVVAARG